MKAFVQTGRLDGVLQRMSPHCDARPAGVVVSLLVLHYISLPAGVFEGECVDRLFTGTWREGDPDEVRNLRVSAHFFHSPQRRNPSVRLYRRSGLARGTLELSGSKRLQRFFGWG